MRECVRAAYASFVRETIRAVLTLPHYVMIPVVVIHAARIVRSSHVAAPGTRRVPLFAFCVPSTLVPGRRGRFECRDRFQTCSY